MKTVAIYARVSSDQQAQQATVQSQLQELKERIVADGHVLLPEHLYVDDGVSGTRLERPALERLRDRVAEGGIETVYVHSPDRLARKYAYQVLLVEEFRNRGVEVVFLNKALGSGPEDELLIQVQGMIAEYERAKIMERSRRGKLYRARQGQLSVMSRAPYGYLYVRKTDQMPANFQVKLHEAKIVRWIFRAFLQEQRSLDNIAKTLSAQGTPPPGQGARWHPSVIRSILLNPAYMGRAAFGKTEQVLRERRQRLFDAHARATLQARRRRPSEQWVWIHVAPIVSQETFEAAREQLERNAKLARRHARPERFLLQGLTVCGRCGRSFCGATGGGGRPNKRTYVYYRCIMARHSAAGAVCKVQPVRADRLDEHVWGSVCKLLEDPQRLTKEWRRRANRDDVFSQQRVLRDDAARVLKSHQRSIQRLLDAYEAGAIELNDLTRRTDALRRRIEDAERELQAANKCLEQMVHLRAIVARLSDFGDQVRRRLASLTWAERQRTVRALVAKVEIDDEGATIVFRVPPEGTGNSARSGPSADRAIPPPAPSNGSCGLRSPRHDMTENPPDTLTAQAGRRVWADHRGD